LDVTPLSLGIETLGGVFTKLIEANTTIPTKKSESFSTAADNQPSVEIHVLQGERPMAKDNKTIGRFHLDGIPPAPRGIPQVEVTFDIDANGILNVSAKDKGTGKEQNIRIEASSGLTDEEINKMKEEAKANADSDQKEREKIDKINTADGLIFQTEKQLKEFGDKLSKPNKKAIQDSLDKLKSIHKEEKIDEIDSAIEALNKSWEAASQEMYKATQEQQGTPDQKTPAGNKSKGKNKNDGISDVDFEEVKEEKK
jgi:molecular chaperone DnaK